MEKISINTYRKVKSPKSRHYIDKQRFTDIVILNKGLQQYTDELGHMCNLLIEGVLKHRSFCGYPNDVKDEMRSYTIMKMMRGVLLFKPESGNAYSYFTRICFTAFLTVIAKYYKQKNIERQILMNEYLSLKSKFPSYSRK